jgi:hypothetical protein
MTRVARALTPAGITPAEQTSIRPGQIARAQPSAIWLRHALPVHTNSTLGFEVMRTALGR